MKAALRALWQRLRPQAEDPREAIHFLHIGKCAGTQVRLLAESVNAQALPVRIVKHPHAVTLAALPPEARYFFATRDPLTRFRAGFYSRQRRGQPFYDYVWSTGEALAFARFAHANDLAEALFSDGQRGQDAFMAMRSVQHAAQNQVDWFGRQGDFFVNRPPVWIIRQEHFSADLAQLSARLGIDLGSTLARLPESGGGIHATDYAGIPELSPLACANLSRWYAQDIAFYQMCEKWIADQAVRG